MVNPSCRTCGDNQDVDELELSISYADLPFKESWWCDYCRHDIDKDGNCVLGIMSGRDCYTCSNGGVYTPICERCGDRSDVSANDDGDWWYCDYCDHDIDSDGLCETNNCSTCKSDDHTWAHCPTCGKNISSKFRDEDNLFWCNDELCPDTKFRVSNLGEIFEDSLSVSTSNVRDSRYVDSPNYEYYYPD